LKTIPLNLIILNDFALKTVLSWIKNIGHFQSILIAKETISKNGKLMIRMVKLKSRSVNRLIKLPCLPMATRYFIFYTF